MGKAKDKMTGSKKEFKCLLLLTVLGVLFVPLTANATLVNVTVTFGDPAADGSTPLFTVDLNASQLRGGWSDTQTNLDLDVCGTIYEDAFFTLTDLTYTGTAASGTTGGGTVKFFADGQDTGTTALVRIDFDSATVSPLHFGGVDTMLFSINSVALSGTEIDGATSEESFAFSFANQQALDGNIENGYTATAAFTCSAFVPEPATVALLGIGGMMIFRRRRFF